MRNSLSQLGVLCAATFLVAALFVRPASADDEVRRLPPVDQTSYQYSDESLLQNPASVADLAPTFPAQSAGENSPPANEPQLPPGARNGIFQKMSFEDSFILGGSGNRSFQQNDASAEITFGFPCPEKSSPLLVSPGFGVHSFDAPQGLNMPAATYDIYTSISWLKPLNEKWTLNLGCTPGVYSDLQDSYSDSFRVSARAIGICNYSPTLKIMVGAAYTPNSPLGWPVMPFGGMIWTPSEDQRYDIMFPMLKYSRRVALSKTADDKNVETWAYCGLGMGGGSWAFRREDGSDDTVTLRDFRFLIGVERKTVGGLTAHLETGYVFERKISFDSNTPNYYPDTAVMVRGGVTY